MDTGTKGRDVKLPAESNLVPSSEMSTAVPLVPHIHLWRARGQIESGIAASSITDT
jgi:hypothetical protein